eukprot:3785931-Rhodomonas_salina.1
MLFFGRWWGYYLVVILAGGLGTLFGAWLHRQYPQDSQGFQRLSVVLSRRPRCHSRLSSAASRAALALFCFALFCSALLCFAVSRLAAKQQDAAVNLDGRMGRGAQTAANALLLWHLLRHSPVLTPHFRSCISSLDTVRCR